MTSSIPLHLPRQPTRPCPRLPLRPPLGRNGVLVAGARHEPGEAAEVRAEVAVPEFPERLTLDAFVNDTRLENRYPKYRYMQLWASDRLVWEEDIAPTREGKEWISLDVTELAKPGAMLKLRFQVVDKRGVSDASVTI